MEVFIDLYNQIKQYPVLHFLFLFLSFTLLFYIAQLILLFWLRKIADKTSNKIDDLIIRVAASLKPAFYWVVSFFITLQFFTLSGLLDRIVLFAIIIIATWQIVKIINVVVEYFIARASEKHEDISTQIALQVGEKIVKALVWVIAFLMILQNSGVNVTSLVAGLGIGGIAVALAAQNILSDLFSSFAILFDKPFIPGDFIIVGNDMGVVEKVGIKTTRIRALQGEEIIIPNKELTSARIQNFKRMSERRIVFTFGVTYQTSRKNLEKIPAIVQNAIEKVEKTRFDRSNFFSFGDSALIFENVYYVLDGDYNLYMAMQEKINLAIMKEFEEEKISMAYPTQTVYVVGNKNSS